MSEYPWSDVIDIGSRRAMVNSVVLWSSRAIKSLCSHSRAHELFADVATGSSRWIHKPAVTAATGGRNQGTVTDQDGRPVSSATVYAVPQALTLEAPCPGRPKQTGWEVLFGGRFRTGTYVLYSRKEEEGYPDPSEPFYADSKAETQVHLTAEKPSATVEVSLGQKAGVLEDASSTSIQVPASMQGWFSTIRMGTAFPYDQKSEYAHSCRRVRM